jgi:SAM-dependent methyltransferase
MLEQAMERWGGDSRFRFVVADIYHLPFIDGLMNSATMIRVIHHIADVPAALGEVRRVMAPGGTFVLEFANKRNLKSMARYALRRQSWNPFAPEPVEFVKLNFDFHPRWMLDHLRQAGFYTERKLSVSYLRLGALKRLAPVQWLVYADAMLQRTAPVGLFSPSVFTRNSSRGAQRASTVSVDRDVIFCSPRSGGALRREGDVLICDADGTRWQARGNFYDFKEPL